MRTEQDQLIDLTETVLKGLRNMRRRRLIKYAYPIVLEGVEGVIIRDLLELIATGEKDTSPEFAGSIFFEDSPILCSKEFSLPGGDMDPLSVR